MEKVSYGGQGSTREIQGEAWELNMKIFSLGNAWEGTRVFSCCRGKFFIDLFWRNSPGYSWVKGIVVNPPGNFRAKGLGNSPGNSCEKLPRNSLRRYPASINQGYSGKRRISAALEI
jgi:hypothetical protein